MKHVGCILSNECADDVNTVAHADMCQFFPTSYLHGIHLDCSRTHLSVAKFIKIQLTTGVKINQIEKALVNITKQAGD
jgi:hypothetical protein